jgi:hypothetical protein
VLFGEARVLSASKKREGRSQGIEQLNRERCQVDERCQATFQTERDKLLCYVFVQY